MFLTMKILKGMKRRGFQDMKGVKKVKEVLRRERKEDHEECEESEAVGRNRERRA